MAVSAARVIPARPDWCAAAVVVARPVAAPSRPAAPAPAAARVSPAASAPTPALPAACRAISAARETSATWGPVTPKFRNASSRRKPGNPPAGPRGRPASRPLPLTPSRKTPKIHAKPPTFRGSNRASGRMALAVSCSRFRQRSRNPPTV
jgi:hypothetical protein